MHRQEEAAAEPQRLAIPGHADVLTSEPKPHRWLIRVLDLELQELLHEARVVLVEGELGQINHPVRRPSSSLLCAQAPNRRASLYTCSIRATTSAHRRS